MLSLEESPGACRGEALFGEKTSVMATVPVLGCVTVSRVDRKLGADVLSLDKCFSEMFNGSTCTGCPVKKVTSMSQDSCNHTLPGETIVSHKS